MLENFKDRYNSPTKGNSGEIIAGQDGNPDLLKVGEYYYLGVINSRLNYDDRVLSSKFASNMYLIHAIIKGDFNRFQTLIQAICNGTKQKDTEILQLATILAAEKSSDPRFIKELLDKRVPLHPHALATAQAIAQEENQYATVDLTLLRCCFDTSLPYRLDGQKQNLPSKKEIKDLLGNSLYQAFTESPHKTYYALARVAGVITFSVLGVITLPATTYLASAGVAAILYCLSDATTQIKAEYIIKTDIKALCDMFSQMIKTISTKHRSQPAHAAAEYDNQSGHVEGYDQKQGVAPGTSSQDHRRRLEAEREKTRQEYAAAINDF